MQEDLALILENKFITSYYKYIRALSSTKERSSMDDMPFLSRYLNEKV
jgi:hypothetical protein